MHIQEAEQHADPVDRASAETESVIEGALSSQTVAYSTYMKNWGPAVDEETGCPTGECRCGCGRDVDPRRIAAGYGLAIECATRIEAKR